MFRAFHTIMLRLALLAVLLHALAPVASHAMMAAMANSGKAFAEICTAQGFQLVEITDESGKKTSHTVKAGHECAVCAAASTPPAPVSDVYADSLPTAGQHFVPVPSSTPAFASTLRLSPPHTGPPIL
jgi:putative hemolysin